MDIQNGDTDIGLKGVRVGVVGLGIMGSAIAGNLRRAGNQVWGFDPLPAACESARSIGIQIVSNLASVPDRTVLVLTSLPSGDSLRQTVETLGSGLSTSCVLGELSTLSLQDKQQARVILRARGIDLLDAPVSGTGAQAIDRDLSVYVSGHETSWKRVEGFFKCFAQRPRYVGEFGCGTRLKYLANLLVAIHNVASAEAMAMAEATGIDLHAAIEILRESAGNSRIFELRAPMMARREYLPATMKLEVWQKDMALIAQFARESKIRTPLFDATKPIYETALRMRPQEDTAGVFEVLRS